jgi:hypothetical protein
LAIFLARSWRGAKQRRQPKIWLPDNRWDISFEKILHLPGEKLMDIVDQLMRDRPIFHAHGVERWDSSLDPLLAIQQAVREGDQTLETGCGASTAVFAAQGARHTAISVDGEEHERVRAYLKRIAVDDGRLRSIIGWSDAVLPQLCTGDRTLDVTFIDGAHAFPYPAIDWHYISRAMKVGGKLLLDDIPIPAVAYVFRFMQSDPHWRLDAILENRAAAFTLIEEPMIDNGDLTDWTRQPFNARQDYGFAPLPSRACLALSSKLARIRQMLGLRYPALRRVRRSILGP